MPYMEDISQNDAKAYIHLTRFRSVLGLLGFSTAVFGPILHEVLPAPTISLPVRVDGNISRDNIGFGHLSNQCEMESYSQGN